VGNRLIEAVLGGSDRTGKPRRNGVTIVLDKGELGPNSIADLAATCGAHWDYAKVAWASSLITGGLENKLACYRRLGITPLFGGTLFEYAYLRNRVPVLLDLARELRVHVEISDGVIDLPRRDKLRWIEAFAAHVEVFSEVGGKLTRQDRPWKQVINEDLAAGAKKVVIEGRELAPVGEEIRADFVDIVLSATSAGNLVFEALERRQQVWFIKYLGPNVNLGNVLPADLLAVESIRRGLMEHTLLHMSQLECEAGRIGTPETSGPVGAEK